MSTLQKLQITLPIIYNLTEANSTAEKAFLDSVRSFRHMLLMILRSEKVNLPDEYNLLDEYFTVQKVDNTQQEQREFFLTTGEKKGQKRFRCIITEKAMMMFSVQKCTKSATHSDKPVWENEYGHEGILVAGFEEFLDGIIATMKRVTG